LKTKSIRKRCIVRIAEWALVVLVVTPKKMNKTEDKIKVTHYWDNPYQEWKAHCVCGKMIMFRNENEGKVIHKWFDENHICLDNNQENKV